jgi:hypothetical protein
VHVHIARRYQRNICLKGKRFKSSQPGTVVWAEKQFCSDPAATFETRLQPEGVFEVRDGFRQQQSEATRQTLFEIATSQLVFALGCPASAAADQFGKIAVAVAIGGEQDKAD